MDDEKDKEMYSQYVSDIQATPPTKSKNEPAHNDIDQQTAQYLANGGEIHKAGPTDSRAYREGGKKRTRREQVKFMKEVLSKNTFNR